MLKDYYITFKLLLDCYCRCY